MPRSTSLHPAASRLIGFIADLLLLALFLLLGVAILNVVIEMIVTVVGLVRISSIPQGFDNPEPGRLRDDLTRLAKAVGGAIGAGFLYWGYLRLRRRMLHLFVDAGFESFVSKRYLLAREGGRLVSLISIVSVLGVAVGTMALIVVLGVMDGFDATLKKKFMGVYSHLEVLPVPGYAEEDVPEPLYKGLMEQLVAMEGIEAAAPVLAHETVIQANAGAEEKKVGVFMRGILPEYEKDVSEFLSYVTRGQATVGPREVILGRVLARKLGVGIGDRVFAIGRIVATANRPSPKMLPLKVVGTFESGLYDVDDRFVITHLETLQDLLVKDNVAGAVHVRLTEPDDAYKIALRVRDDIIPVGFGVRTWQDINTEFFKALWIEKVAMSIILLLIVLVAALNIIGTLVMTVVQKTRDIGILKSMGSPSGAILRIFLYHGFLIGLMGASLGSAWGLRILFFVRTDIEKIFELPPGVYGLDQLPVVIDPLQIGILAGAALVICVGASIIPAWQAARLNPVEALRYD